MLASLLETVGGYAGLLAHNTMEIEMLLMMVYIFSIIWSLGCNIGEPKPNIKTKASQLLKAKIMKIFISFPIEGEIYDYYCDFKS